MTELDHSGDGAGLRPGRRRVVALRWEWQDEAACQDMSGELFFGPDGERAQARFDRETQAVQVCAGCPVRQACRSHALTRPEPYGVWGGLTELDRQRLRKARGADRAA